MKLLWLMVFLALGSVACGDKESGTKNGDANSENGMFCQVGTPDCGCSKDFPCQDEGYFCVDEVCKECPDGEENCGCLEGGACNDDLVCTVTDPECVALCEPPSCQQASAPSCGPQELCNRTINECMESITEEACLDFYATPANCTDMPAYTSCNCDCVTQPTCTEYLACGTNCFNENCM